MPTYYNYHGIIKTKIRTGKLERYEFIDSYKNLGTVLMLYFEDGTKRPVREKMWLEYFILIDKYFLNKKD